MAGGTVRSIALALALGLAGEGALAALIVDTAGARQAIANPAIAAQDAALSALAADGRATELAARLELISHDRTLAEVAQEWLLDRGLHALARIAPTRAARAAVVRLASRAPVVYTRIDPDHGDRVTPLYDAGATARFVLRAWDRDAARAIAQAELAAGSTAAIDRFAARGAAGATDPVLEGIAGAFRSAQAAQLRAQRAAVIDAIAQGRRVDELALILAARLADPELFGLVVDNADPTVALAAIPAIERSLDSQSALEVLARASRRADIASAAVLAAGRLAGNDAVARQFLFDALAAPDIGPSAAAALGRISDPAVSTEIGRRLAAARDEPSRRILVLALRLDPAPAARAELERFAQTGAGSEQLQQEVRQWLER